MAELNLSSFLSLCYEGTISFDYLVGKVIGGMRGMTGLLWEGSLLDADEVYISSIYSSATILGCEISSLNYRSINLQFAGNSF